MRPYDVRNQQLTQGIKMRKLVVSYAGLLAWQGRVTYDLSLGPRGPGPMAHGTAKQIDKSVNIGLAGEIYKGHCVYVQGGHSRS
jgi:hypothetical protein